MSNLNSQSAIADLSYRNYDGPINGAGHKWLVIARTMIAKALALRSFWTFSLLSGWYYLVMIVILFFVQQIGANGPAGQQAYQALLGRLVWKDQFLHGFGFAQHLLMVVTLLVGAGTIANDNRANALLVYLSKPCSKLDYLIGKWVGVFVPLLIVLVLPTLSFYIYGVFSFREDGFISKDPWLIARVICLLPLAAAVHSSLILAISSLFKQGTVAGAVYAGIYFMGYFFTLLMRVIWAVTQPSNSVVVVDLNYCSIDGILIGLSKALLQSGNSRPFGMPAGPLGAVPAPSLALLLPVVAIVVAGSIAFTWSRVRAVEVV